MDGLLGRSGLGRETVRHQGGGREHCVRNPCDRFLRTTGSGGLVDSRVVVRNARFSILFFLVHES